MNNTTTYPAVKRVTLVSVLTNTALGVVKTVLGYLGHSHAVFADGLHSFSDLLSDLLVLLAAKFGSQAADHNHPYGHRRIETVATVAVALLVLLTGVGILLDATQTLIQGHRLTAPSNYVLWVAIFSVLANEALYRYTAWVGKRIGSNLLHANAWHSRGDAFSSLVVVVGVIGALLGVLWLDNVAAIIVGVIVIKMGWSLGVSGISELVDTGVSQDMLDRIEHSIVTTDGVRAVHCLRTRSMAGDIYVDVHILVCPHLTVSEGHYISHAVQRRLGDQFDKIIDVTVHVDPEDDLQSALCEQLPSRSDLLPRLEALWQGLPGCDHIDEIQLHYLAGKVEVVLYILAEHHPTLLADLNTLQRRYQDSVAHLSVIAQLTLWAGSQHL